MLTIVRFRYWIGLLEMRHADLLLEAHTLATVMRHRTKQHEGENPANSQKPPEWSEYYKSIEYLSSNSLSNYKPLSKQFSGHNEPFYTIVHIRLWSMGLEGGIRGSGVSQGWHPTDLSLPLGDANGTDAESIVGLNEMKRGLNFGTSQWTFWHFYNERMDGNGHEYVIVNTWILVTSVTSFHIHVKDFWDRGSDSNLTMWPFLFL